MITIEEITPTMAERYLSVNTHNRILREKVVEKYAKMLTEGEWDFNGESIKFDTNDTLLDGQHRLWAVIESGLPMKTYVVRGLKPEVMQTIDTGAARTAGSLLQIEGMSNSNTVAAAARLLYSYENGIWGKKEKSLDPYCSHRTIVETVKKHPGLIESASYIVTNNHNLRPFVAGSIATALHYIFRQIDKQKCDEFFNRLIHGNNLNVGDPVLSLRSALFRMSGSDRQVRMFRTALIIKAWNLFIQNKKSNVLVWRNFEEFPKPQQRKKAI